MSPFYKPYCGYIKRRRLKNEITLIAKVFGPFEWPDKYYSPGEQRLFHSSLNFIFSSSLIFIHLFLKPGE